MMASDIEEFQRNIILLDGTYRILTLEAVLLMLSVKAELSNFTLIFKASDIIARY
jgi:hypothetical protein